MICWGEESIDGKDKKSWLLFRDTDGIHCHFAPSHCALRNYTRREAKNCDDLYVRSGSGIHPRTGL